MTRSCERSKLALKSFDELLNELVGLIGRQTRTLIDLGETLHDSSPLGLGLLNLSPHHIVIIFAQEIDLGFHFSTELLVSGAQRLGLAVAGAPFRFRLQNLCSQDIAKLVVVADEHLDFIDDRSI